MTASEPVLHLAGVEKRFRYRPYAKGSQTLKGALIDALLGRRPAPVVVEALRGVDLTLGPGEALGVVGRNGSGKTTLLRLAAGVYRPDAGEVRVRGRRAALLELGAGFHPELSGWENAEIAALAAGLTRREHQARRGEIAAFAGLDGAMDAPLRTWSAGMVLRLGFAVATALEPELLIVDEVLAVGDLEFQAKCLERVASLRARGAALLLASHDLGLIEARCERAAWLDQGKCAALGPAAEVCASYRGASKA